jgi:peroxin-10
MHWLGTRWLTRWDKEVELLVKLTYYGIMTGRGMSSYC